jgi:hypothetical protein
MPVARVQIPYGVHRWLVFAQRRRAFRDFVSLGILGFNCYNDQILMCMAAAHRRINRLNIKDMNTESGHGDSGNHSNEKQPTDGV